MPLSRDLVSRFAKMTKEEKTKTEKIVYGTIVESEGEKYVQIDGSNRLTPIATTVDMISGERVTVMMKNHKAVVTGNMSSPAARTDDVKTQITGADKIATNYIRSSDSGLIFGDHTVSELLYNILMSASELSVRNGSSNVAKFTNDLIEIGKSDATVNLYGASLYHYIGGVAYKPYYQAGDSFEIEWHGCGYISNSGADVNFSIPISRPVIGAPTVSVESVNGFILCQGSAYTHGSSSSTYAKPSSYSASLSGDGGVVNVVASFGNTTNATNNAPCGIAASIKITFS